MRMIGLLGWAGAAMAAPAHSAVTATSDVGFVTESEVESQRTPTPSMRC